ncbi:hypothetical protein XENOCAPTIV_000387 [Xenoophorus captivus]|uniref:Uncharacterized protein n=1 Tax=Xenoophorus captivus TaxID=1517983 RepID=A0ABV0SCI5_9TELE
MRPTTLNSAAWMWTSCSGGWMLTWRAESLSESSSDQVGGAGPGAAGEQVSAPSGRQVEAVMFCRPGMMSNCTLSVWVRMDQMSSSMVTSCQTQNLKNMFQIQQHSSFFSRCFSPGLQVWGNLTRSSTEHETKTLNVQNSYLSVRLRPASQCTQAVLSYSCMQNQQLVKEEGPARSASPSLLLATVGQRVLSRLDDGSGCTSPERVVALWTEEGIRNSQEILQTLDFPLEERLSLADLTLVLDNELLVSGNGIHQAALISYKTEIQHLQEVAEQACRERDKLRTDLDLAQQRNLQLVREVDDRHASMETLNESKIRSDCCWGFGNHVSQNALCSSRK